ncbi:MAG: tetratricopeptide repeat protein [Spirochaetales bacterium]|nr:tetratricopeptide repeat protein [Spirochaetales bacterium]
MKIAFPTFLLFIILCSSGCVTRIDPYKEEISSVEIFQKAYEATDIRNYSLAISYYKAFMERFPDDRKGCIWAQYEIAFLHHKMGKDDKAVELFNELLKKYEEEDGVLLPEAPRILSEKVMKAISRKKDKSPKTE